MNITTAFPSKFLKGAELDEDMTVTIKKIAMETVGQDANKEDKPVVYFIETDQALALNKTNSNTIAGMYGNETDTWVGKQITLYPTEVEFQGKMTLAIRVRMKKPTGAVRPSPVSAPSDPFTAPVDPLAEAKVEAWNAFLSKWTPFEAANPGEATSRNVKFQVACLEYAKTVNKNLPELVATDYKLMAVEITKNFHVATGTYLTF